MDFRKINNKYKQAIKDIKYACESECIEGVTGYVVDTSIILDIINNLEKNI
nr:MAG TPA: METALLOTHIONEIN 1, AMT, METAL REGULATION, TRANSLATION-REGULATION [Caudoviricetes sp.]